MSFVKVEAITTNKALFRTTALAGSALVWGVLGYLALTYVPKLQKVFVPPEVIIDGYTPPKPVEPPPLPPRPEPVVREVQTPTLLPQDTVVTPPTITTRTTTSTRPNPLQSDSPSGPPAPGPTIDLGAGSGSAPIPYEAPPIMAEPVNVPYVAEPAPPPPAPKLIVNPVRLSGANPVFPNRALDRGVSGEVTLSFTVTATGQVENIDVTGEEPRGYGFARAARDAIAGWRFQPQTVDGVAVAYPARYTISFKLEE